MTIEEIKDEAFAFINDARALKTTRAKFYEASGVDQLQFVYNGCDLLLASSVVPEIKKAPTVKHISFDPANPSQFVKAIHEYTDRLNAIEDEWNAIVREATIKARIKEFGERGMKALLSRAFDDKKIKYSLFESNGRKIINIDGNYKYEVRLSLPLDHSKIMETIPTLIEKVLNLQRHISIESNATYKYIAEKMFWKGLPEILRWDFEGNGYDDAENEKKRKIYEDVSDKGDTLDFQPVPNTKEQLLAALIDAGVHAEMVVSPFCHTQKDIQITDGEFTIVITNGKLPGMLVANSSFIRENIYVSHAPVDQVVEWVKYACENLAPIANEVIPIANELKARKRELTLATRNADRLFDSPEISGGRNFFKSGSGDFEVEGIGSLISNRIRIENIAEPKKYVADLADIAQYMVELKKKFYSKE